MGVRCLGPSPKKIVFFTPSLIGAKLSKRSDIFNSGQIVQNWHIIVRIKYNDYILYRIYGSISMYPTLCPYPLGLYMTYIPKFLAQYITATLRLGGPNNVGELLYVKLISTDISVTVAQIKKNKKKKSTFFLLQILLLGGPSPPSQLVPNP